MKPGEEYKLKENYSSFKGTLLKDDEVTIDHLKEDGIHVGIKDAFNRPWVVPKQVLVKVTG